MRHVRPRAPPTLTVMRNIRHIAALVVAATTLLTVAACGPEDTGGSAGNDNPASEQQEAGEKAEAEATETAALPDLTRKGLQAAQDSAQEAGFHNLTSHDSTGRARVQAFDRNWKVCFQSPAPGEHPTTTEIDLGAVKLEEECPAKDEGAPGAQQKAGEVMPDFTGKGVKAAREALPGNTSLMVEDASGEDRMVLMESNWTVCGQDPAPGAKLDGQPVTLKAVKAEENCP